MAPGSRSSPPDLAREIDDRILRIRTRQLELPVDRLLDMLRRGELVVDPRYARLFRWSAGRQSRYIESLILGLPVPPIAVVELDTVASYALLDGLNRVYSLAHFIEGYPADATRRLRLADCDVVPRLNGTTFDSLPEQLQLRLRHATIRADVLSKESESRLHYYLFKRLNSGVGAPSEHEVRECGLRLLDTWFVDFVASLARTPEFVMATMPLADERRARQFESELVLRFLGFKNFRYEYRGDRADFLSEYTEAITEGKIPFEREKERALFTKTFLILGSTLGENAFTLVNMQGAFGFHFVDDHFEPFTLALQPFLHKIDFANGEQIDQVTAALVSAKQSPAFRRPVGRPYLMSGADLQARIEIVEREIERHLSV